MNFKNIEGQLARWLEELSQYDIIIQHRSGKKHKNADALSRIPDQLNPCFNYRAGVDVSTLPCGGCKFCQRAQEQWATFEEEIDYVTPLVIRRIETHEFSTNSVWVEKIPIENIAKLQRQDKNIYTSIDNLEGS